MKKENIDALLAKYWEGKSSLEEERLLKTYFSSGEVFSEHQAYQQLFVFFDNEAKVTYSGKAEKVIDKRKKIIGLPRLAAAASVILLVGMSIFFYLKTNPLQTNLDDSWAKYEIQDPEEAKAAAVDALAFLSVKLNKGKTNVKTNMKALNKFPLK